MLFTLPPVPYNIRELKNVVRFFIQGYTLVHNFNVLNGIECLRIKFIYYPDHLFQIIPLNNTVYQVNLLPGTMRLHNRDAISAQAE